MLWVVESFEANGDGTLTEKGKRLAKEKVSGWFFFILKDSQIYR